MIALLSNINCDPIIRRIGKSVPCLDSVGYGSVLELLLNPDSTVSIANPEQIIILMDLREMVKMDENYSEIIDNFFAGLGSVLHQGKQYFISDAAYYCPVEVDYRGESPGRMASLYWDSALSEFCRTNRGVYIFPLRECVENIGAQSFYSDKLWYMGSTRYSMNAVKRISEEVLRLSAAASGKTKKALVLDLDNTLWGGVIGEDGLDGIKLADSGIGKAYKEFQAVLRYLKESGTILTIVSKNNEADALEAIEKHPHMLLHRNDFAASRINWSSKAANIKELAKELNIGLDSMVFVDDNPQERQEVKEFLPQVTVPDFPEQPEQLLQFAKNLVQTYFRKIEITGEDRSKTEQYKAMQRIAEAKKGAADFSSFLKSLRLRVVKKKPSEYMDRIAQIVQKTNQFNTTVERYSTSQLENMLKSDNWRLYIYEISDCYANHGLCAFAAVKIEETPIIENFLMSCRVMGRNIEYGILRDIETSLFEEGFNEIRAIYYKGQKNFPVEELYDRAGYTVVFSDSDSGEKHYCKKKNDEKKAEEFIGEVLSE